MGKAKRRLGLLVFWLVVWQLLRLGIHYGCPRMEWLLPSPKETLTSLWQLLFLSEFYKSIGATMLRVVLGILFSFLAGTLSALLSYYSSLSRELFSGITSVLKATPVMAVIIYGLLLLKSGQVPVFVCFLMCYPVVYTNVLSGLDQVETGFLEMAQVYNLGFWDRLSCIYYPSAKPQIKAAGSLTAGLAWKTVVAGEVLSIPDYSMGYQLMEAKLYFDISGLLAWIFVIVFVSILFEKAIKGVLAWI